MIIKDIAIIGVGNLAQSLLYRLESSKAKVKIRLYDKNTQKKSLAKKSTITYSDVIDHHLIKSQVIIIAVKPNQYKGICRDIKRFYSKSSVIISLMAGVRTTNLIKELNPETPIARVMTNVNSKYGNASTFIFSNKFCKDSKTISIKRFFNIFGTSHIVENENKIDKVTALTGSGPAYFIHFLEAIIQTFKKFGFSENEAKTYAKELFYGTAITCMDEKKSLKKIKDSVISKGGTTDAALKNLDALKFKSILTKSIKEAYNKAQQLGKNK